MTDNQDSPEHGGARIVDRDAAVEVLVAHFLRYFPGRVKFRKKIGQDPGRVSVEVDQEVAGVGGRHISGLNQLCHEF